MLLNFIVIVQEPWKASVSEVNQITPRDGTEPRALDVNNTKLTILTTFALQSKVIEDATEEGFLRGYRASPELLAYCFFACA